MISEYFFEALSIPSWWICLGLTYLILFFLLLSRKIEIYFKVQIYRFQNLSE